MPDVRTLAVLALAAYVGGCKSIRSVFKDMNFPEEPDTRTTPLSRVQARDVRIFATLGPLVASGFASPALVAPCLGAVLDDRESVEKLHAFGACLSTRSGPRDVAWKECVTSGFPTLACHEAPGALCAQDVAGGCAAATVKQWTCKDALPQACSGIHERDRVPVHTTLAQIGEALAAFELHDRGPMLAAGAGTVATSRLSDSEWGALQRALRAAVAMTSCATSEIGGWCARQPTSTSPRPAIALSGGSANGAFLAGYVYELFLAREAAIVQNTRFADDRITGVTGTSVGALIAPMVDLYFADEPSAVTKLGAKALEWCRAATTIKTATYTPPPDCSGASGKDCDPIPPEGTRSIPRCALRMLRRYFTDVRTQDLLCVNDGYFHEPFGAGDFLQGPYTSLGAFEPLETKIIGPFMDQFSSALLGNDVVRVLMTADVSTNTLIGLDERACRGPNPGRCLAEGVLASIPNPIFARGPHHVSMGLQEIDRLPTNGHWLDGGLRSGVPALRAMLLTRVSNSLGTRGRVLALSTERSEDRHGPIPTGGLENAVVSVGAVVQQGHLWETAFAALFQEDRARRAALIQALLHPPTGTATAFPVGPFGDVFAVFTPAELEPKELAASGYQFDPLWMRGLFLWGQRVAIDQMRDSSRNVLTFLNWTIHQRPEWPAWAERRRAAIDARLASWKREVDTAKRDWAEHVATRREDIDAMDTCRGGVTP